MSSICVTVTEADLDPTPPDVKIETSRPQTLKRFKEVCISLSGRVGFSETLSSLSSWRAEGLPDIPHVRWGSEEERLNGLLCGRLWRKTLRLLLFPSFWAFGDVFFWIQTSLLWCFPGSWNEEPRYHLHCLEESGKTPAVCGVAQNSRLWFSVPAETPPHDTFV